MKLYDPNINPRFLKEANEIQRRDEIETYKLGKERNERALKELYAQTGYTKTDVEDELRRGFYAYYRFYGVTDRYIQRELDDFQRTYDTYYNNMEKRS